MNLESFKLQIYYHVQLRRTGWAGQGREQKMQFVAICFKKTFFNTSRRRVFGVLKFLLFNSLVQLTKTFSLAFLSIHFFFPFWWWSTWRLWHFAFDRNDNESSFYPSQSTPCKHPVIVLQDVAFTDLHALVEFIYHGEVNVHQRSLSSFLKTAEVLRVSGLTQQQAEETHNVSFCILIIEVNLNKMKIKITVSSSTKYGSRRWQNSTESSSKFHR